MEDQSTMKLDEMIQSLAQLYVSSNNSPYTVEEFSEMLKGYIITSGVPLQKVRKEYKMSIKKKQNQIDPLVPLTPDEEVFEVESLGSLKLPRGTGDMLLGDIMGFISRNSNTIKEVVSTVGNAINSQRAQTNSEQARLNGALESIDPMRFDTVKDIIKRARKLKLNRNIS